MWISGRGTPSPLPGAGLVAAAVLAFVPPSYGAKAWRTYDNCHLVKSESNDGDSFHAKYTRPGYGRRYFVRLYWVDTPESDNSVPDRVKEQAEYWGISEADVVKLGKEATHFTAHFLKDGFILHSKLQDARGRSDRKRNYGNVRVGDAYLSEALVAAGLARIYGFQELHPEGPKPETFRLRLKAAESRARQNKLGVWGLAAHTGDAGRLRVPHPDPHRFLDTAPAPDTPVVTPAAPATAAQPAEVTEGEEVRVGRPLAVYSLKDNRHVGTLHPGQMVTIVGPEPNNMMRIRFQVSDKRILEAQCYRYDLGR